MPYKGDVYHICVCMYVKYINTSYEKVGFGGGTIYIYIEFTETSTHSCAPKSPGVDHQALQLQSVSHPALRS